MAPLSISVYGLRRLIVICQEFIDRHGIIYNVKKNEIMAFGAGDQRLIVVPPVNLYETSLTRVHKFKYLVHLLTADLRDDEDTERERRALSVRANVGSQVCTLLPCRLK